MNAADGVKHITPASELVRGAPVAEWRRLHDAALLFKRLAPWQWMTPRDYFGVQASPSAPIAFISLMGTGDGSQEALFAFLGWQAIQRISSLSRTQRLTIRDLIEAPTLQLAFLKQSETTLEELQLWRSCGVELSESIPILRSHRPGYLPWLLEGNEVATMTAIVQQTIGYAMRCESDPSLLHPEGPAEIRVFRREDGATWQEELKEIPPAANTALPEINTTKLQQVVALATHPERVEFDLALSRATIGEPGERLRTTYLLAAFDSDNGNCIGADVIAPQEGIEELWLSVPERLLDLCLHAGHRPREIEVRSTMMMNTLRPLLGRLPLRLTFRSELPHFEAFLKGMNRVAQPQERRL